jgi:hypothetical protein
MKPRTRRCLSLASHELQTNGISICPSDGSSLDFKRALLKTDCPRSRPSGTARSSCRPDRGSSISSKCYRRKTLAHALVSQITMDNLQGDVAPYELPLGDLLHDRRAKRDRRRHDRGRRASHLWPGKVVTEITFAGDFWEAEPEHQDYLEHYPDGYTCHFVRPGWKLPKRAKFGCFVALRECRDGKRIDRKSPANRQTGAFDPACVETRALGR